MGNAPNSDHVMVVILLPDDPLPTGLWYVVTAWAADRRRRRTYWDGEDLMTPADRDLLDKINLEARDSDPGRGTEQRCRRKRGSKAQSVVCGLRLPAARVEQLQRLAASRGIEPSALVRQWITAQLDAAEHGTRDCGAERWERDLRATTEHLRRLLDERPGA